MLQDYCSMSKIKMEEKISRRRKTLLSFPLHSHISEAAFINTGVEA